MRLLGVHGPMRGLFAGKTSPYVYTARHNSWATWWCNALRGGLAEGTVITQYRALLSLTPSPSRLPTRHPFQGSVLVFLPDVLDIEQLSNALSLHPLATEMLLFPLHPLVSPVQLRCVHGRGSPLRKVVLCTGLCDAVVTLEDVLFVIDCGHVQRPVYDAAADAVRTEQVPVSQSTAQLRRARAGRLQSGVVVHMFPKYKMQLLAPRPSPELTHGCLHVPILLLSATRSASCQVCACILSSSLWQGPRPRSRGIQFCWSQPKGDGSEGDLTGARRLLEDNRRHFEANKWSAMLSDGVVSNGVLAMARPCFCFWFAGEFGDRAVEAGGETRGSANDRSYQ